MPFSLKKLYDKKCTIQNEQSYTRAEESIDKKQIFHTKTLSLLKLKSTKSTITKTGRRYQK